MAELNRQQLAQAKAELERIADVLGQLSAWLTTNDEDQTAILLEDAWRDITAAGHVLERRKRRYAAGWLGGQLRPVRPSALLRGDSSSHDRRPLTWHYAPIPASCYFPRYFEGYFGPSGSVNVFDEVGLKAAGKPSVPGSADLAAPCLRDHGSGGVAAATRRRTATELPAQRFACPPTQRGGHRADTVHIPRSQSVDRR